MIFARSPYIVTIDETGQESTRLELFIWNGTGSAPAFPSYSLSKQVPSINNINTYYNISPFLREYFDFNQSNPTVSGTDDLTNQYAYCNVTYKTYYSIDGIETLIDTFTDKCFDGYALYENGSNYSGQNVLLSDKSLAGGSNAYNYPCSTFWTTCGTGNCDCIGVSFTYNGVNYEYNVPKIEEGYFSLFIADGDFVLVNINIVLQEAFWLFSGGSSDPNHPFNQNNPVYHWTFFGESPDCPKTDQWTYIEGATLESFSTTGYYNANVGGFSLLTGDGSCNTINLTFSYNGVSYLYNVPKTGDDLYELYIEEGGEIVTTVNMVIEEPFWYLSGSSNIETNPFFGDNVIYRWSSVDDCPKTDQWEYVSGNEVDNLTTDNSFWFAKYTDVKTGDNQTININANTVYDITKVYTPYILNGNKVEILDGDEVVQDTYYFLPQCECKYEVITCDFVNRWGGWQREFFYKASTESVEMSNTQYKLNPTNFPNYNLYEGQTKNFNTNAKRSIKVNTGWVEENYKVTIEEMLLSETIRINGLPAVLKTKSVEKFKSINTKTINYQMEFEMAYDVLNTII